jgi:hypothetical protein
MNKSMDNEISDGWGSESLPDAYIGTAWINRHGDVAFNIPFGDPSSRD